MPDPVSLEGAEGRVTLWRHRERPGIGGPGVWFLSTGAPDNDQFTEVMEFVPASLVDDLRAEIERLNSLPIADTGRGRDQLPRLPVFGRTQRAEREVADLQAERDRLRLQVVALKAIGDPEAYSLRSSLDAAVHEAEEHAEARRDLQARLSRAEEALAEAVLPLEVIAGQNRVKPYKELSSDLILQVGRSIAAVRAALDGDADE